MSAKPLFEVRKVSKAFGQAVLLEQADLEVFPNETLAIIGDSGSGKSVFLKMLAGLVPIDEGEILYKGERVADMDRSALDRLHRQVGYVFQSDALFDSMTVLDNIGYGLREHTKMDDAAIRARAESCIDLVNLKRADLEKFPASLSGGMRKRVALARAIAIEPEVILYDEPTQGLDPQNITNIAQMIEQLQRDLKATSVVVTHDMRTAFGVSDRIVLLHEHKFQFGGTPQELLHTKEPILREFIDEAMEEIEEMFREQAKGHTVPAP
ncbi:MAG: ATP-binding cassette domain-containing protein [Deltaproteobacteria bacterium]|nr:ATP-binding cassette domain-containing protein [Nannocystaceae bacterium]